MSSSTASARSSQRFASSCPEESFGRPMNLLGNKHSISRRSRPMLNRCVNVAALALALAIPGCAAINEDVGSGSSADSSSIPNQTAWAQGTNWTYQENFMGLPRAWVYKPNSFSKKSPTQRGAIFHLMGCGQMTFQSAQGWG